MRWLSDMVGAGGQFEPHGYCLLWLPWLIWTHVIADAVIAIAYFSIPVALVYFVRKRPDVAFGWVVWMFALFIVACGTTHAMSVWVLWHGDYILEGLIKAVTAAASIATAILLWPAIPKILALPSPSQLAAERDKLATALEQLMNETAQRKRIEAELRQAQTFQRRGSAVDDSVPDVAMGGRRKSASESALTALAADLEALVSRLAGEFDHGFISFDTAEQLRELLARAEEL